MIQKSIRVCEKYETAANSHANMLHNLSGRVIIYLVADVCVRYEGGKYAKY